MGLFKFNGIGIQSLSVTVPKSIVETINQTQLFNEEQLRKFIETTGVKERRIADTEVCSSDLCYDAAIKLFEKTNIEREKIDALIFISQTPDYKVPGTSIILQDKLNLSKDTLAFDINLTCSGFVNGLFFSYSLLQNENINNVLLLVGETLSKITSKEDKSTGLLLGDAGCATLLAKDEKYGASYFSLNTDGSAYKSVIVPAGGFRNMSSKYTLESKTYSDGSIRNDEQLRMDGMDVFSFAVSEIPKDVKKILNFAKMDISIIDKVVFHQSNKYMMDVIAKKSKVDLSKMIYSIHKYGNTSGVSIPSAIAEQKKSITNHDILLLNAIGAGFSWGTAILKLVDCEILDINEI
ncbi:3-oxoacyl-ACP synthase III family protein [Petrimonas sp.]|uniref:3-oxoacyl-ACP synthase III family protein n=1 Tax=Petrimonas sp. TaxID=2023866 RepID=UPI002FC60700